MSPDLDPTTVAIAAALVVTRDPDEVAEMAAEFGFIDIPGFHRAAVARWYADQMKAQGAKFIGDLDPAAVEPATAPPLVRALARVRQEHDSGAVA